MVLVGHDAHHHGDFLIGEQLTQCLRGGVEAMGVVAPIQEEHRLLAEQLHTGGPLDLRHSSKDRNIGYGKAALLQLLHSSQHHGGVLHLMAADQG